MEWRPRQDWRVAKHDFRRAKLRFLCGFPGRRVLDRDLHVLSLPRDPRRFVSELELPDREDVPVRPLRVAHDEVSVLGDDGPAALDNPGIHELARGRVRNLDLECHVLHLLFLYEESRRQFLARFRRGDENRDVSDRQGVLGVA